MLIAQLTDFHYLSEGTRLFGYVDVHGMLVRAVDHVLASPNVPDCAVITGDIVNDGTEADHLAVADILGRLPCPVYVTPGNHDKRAMMGVLPNGATEKLAFFRVIDDFPVRIIMCDSLVEGAHHGELGEEQLSLLDKALTDNPDKPTVIAFHHPPFETGVTFMDSIRLNDAEALETTLRKFNNINVVLCGHLHRMIVKGFAGTVAMTAPGTAHQVTLDFADASRPRWVMEPPGYLLHRWSEGAGLVTHRVYLDDYGPRAPFHDNHTHVV
ncbi:MAG: phosphodiesterase [Pseudomonadota bacterium]